MAPRKRRDVGRVKSSTTPPPTTTLVVDTRGFAALPDEIYLEIVSHIPSVPIPTPVSIHLESYPDIRRSRHETLLSLTQTSRSLRRFFWRYLWQRIEVREGMKFENRNDTLKDSRTVNSCKKYATELVRQLEIVTIRNPQLAQYVNYLDIFISKYSLKGVLAELARCLSLFENLHTVQIEVDPNGGDPLEEIFVETFQKYSYPQIRNVFIMFPSVSFVASCPRARRVGFTRNCSSSLCGKKLLRICPHLEILEDIGDVFWTPYACNFIVYNFPNLWIIDFRMFPSTTIYGGSPSSHIDIFKELNHLQTIIMRAPLWQDPMDTVKEYWIESAKHILIHIQLRDNLEKTVVVLDYDDTERRILLKPNTQWH